LFQTIAKDLLAKYLKEPSFKELVDPKKDSFLLDSKISKDNEKKPCCRG